MGRSARVELTRRPYSRGLHAAASPALRAPGCARGAAPQGADDGEFILPYEVLEVVTVADSANDADPEASGLLIGRFTWVAWEYAKDETRVDFLGVDCMIAPFAIEDAAAAGN